jgi:hypothetical protein
VKRPSRERQRPASELDDQDFEQRGVARARPHAVAPEPTSWAQRNWVSIVGLSVGLLVSLWRFGPSHQSRSVPGGGRFADAPFHWQQSVTAGHHVDIKGMSGAVRAVASEGDQLEVNAIRRSRGGVNPAEVPIAVIEKDGDFTVCAAAPGAPQDCADGDDQQRGVSVEYLIRVPKGVAFEASTVNGGITVEGLTAAVDVETVNGGIQIATTGGARAETVNGGIRASVGSTSQDLSFETVNGSISVSLPEDASVDVRAETLSGSISSDFPLNIPKVRPGQQKTASGRIGSGGHELRLETVNGSIGLHRGGGTGELPQAPSPPRGPRPLRSGRR